MQFSSVSLSASLLRAITEIGYEEMTPIQEKTIPLLLSGADVIGRSNTGTGKTAAFSLPILEKMGADVPDYVYALVLCPTRELAMQAREEILKFSQYQLGIKSVAIYGGASMDRQIYQLKSGANIVIGTPGRVLDHIRRRTLKLDAVKTVILDEADVMLDMGFREDIEAILGCTPEERQVALFSATMPEPILALTQTYQKDPVYVEIESESRCVDAIEQYYVYVPLTRKIDALQFLLAAYHPVSTMIFCNTKAGVDELAQALQTRGLPAIGLHGDMKQFQRTQVMQGFKSGRHTILIATDVAARGIDVKGIDAIINYDLPQDREYYIHRIGRTGRAGKSGIAFNIVCGRRDEAEIHALAQFTKSEIPEIAMPTLAQIRDKAVLAVKEELLEIDATSVSHEAWQILGEIAEDGRDISTILASLIDQKITESQGNLPKEDIPPRVARSGSGVVRIHINAGKRDAIAPKNVLAALTKATRLSGKSFGKILIRDNFTTVEVPMADADYVIESMNGRSIAGKSITVRHFTEEGHHNNRPNQRGKSRGNQSYSQKKGNARPHTGRAHQRKG